MYQVVIKSRWKDRKDIYLEIKSYIIPSVGFSKQLDYSEYNMTNIFLVSQILPIYALK